MLKPLLIAYLMLFPARFFEMLASQIWYKNLIREWIQSLAPQSRYVAAELGSGPGIIAEYLAGRVKSVLAIDKSVQMTHFAKKRRKGRNLEFRHGDAFAEGLLRKNSFDLIIASSLLNIVGNKEKLVRNVVNGLTGSGLLSFLFPAPTMTLERASKYAAGQGMHGISRDLLQLWATFAAKLDPHDAIGLFPKASQGVIAVNAFMDGMVTSVTYTSRWQGEGS